MLFYAVASLLIAGSYAQYDPRGSCINFVAFDYDFYKGAGLWYEYATTYDQYHNSLRCIIENWYAPEGNSTRLVTTAISKSTGSQLVTESTYTKDKGNRKLHVVSPVPLVGIQTIDFFDIEDIYRDYIITSFCVEEGSTSVPAILILTRTPNPRTNVIARAQYLARQKGLSVGKFVRLDTDCS